MNAVAAADRVLDRDVSLRNGRAVFKFPSPDGVFVTQPTTFVLSDNINSITDILI